MEGEQPRFKGDGVAVWVNKDKNGKKYLSIQILGKNGIKVNAFKNEPRQEAQPQPQPRPQPATVEEDVL